MMRRGIGRRPVGRGGLVGTAARTAVVAGTATAVAGGVSRHQQAKAQEAADAQAWEQQQQEAAMQAAYAQQQAAAPSPPPPAAPAGDPTVAELEKLAALKQQGILSDDEFAAAKAKLLGI
jgi:hypothetical protein